MNTNLLRRAFMLNNKKFLINQIHRNYPAGVKRHSHHGGVPGENLPFGKSLGKPGRLTMIFVLFFGSGMWVPQVAFLYMMIKAY